MNVKDIEQQFQKAIAENADMVNQIVLDPAKINVAVVFAEAQVVLLKTAANANEINMRESIAAFRRLGACLIGIATVTEEALQ